MKKTRDPAIPETLGGWLAASHGPELGCPEPDAWARYASGEAAAAEREELEEHARSCAACAAERDLARVFADDARDPQASRTRRDEDADAIVAALESGSSVAEAPSETPAVTPNVWGGAARSRRKAVAIWLAAAGVLVALGGLYQLQTGGQLRRGGRTSLPEPVPEDVARGAVVELIAPRGELDEPPTVFEWSALDGASSYAVELTRIDGQPVWTGRSTGASVTLEGGPELSPGVVFHWSVTAFDANGEVIGESPPGSFRISPKPAASPP